MTRPLNINNDRLTSLISNVITSFSKMSNNYNCWLILKKSSLLLINPPLRMRGGVNLGTFVCFAFVLGSDCFSGLKSAGDF